MKQKAQQLTEEQKTFVRLNKFTLKPQELADKLGIDKKIIKNWAHVQRIKLKREPMIPRPKPQPDNNGFFNVDFYSGQYSWIV